MLTNLASLVFNHLLGRAAPAETTSGLFSIFNLVKVRRVLMIFAGLGASLVLFSGGFLTVLLDMILTTREHAQLMLSPASIVGFGLIALSFLTMALLFSRKVWKLQGRQIAQDTTLAPSPVQNALADLIRDFIEERRIGRDLAIQNFASQAPPTPAAETQTSTPGGTFVSSPPPPIFN